MTPADVAGAWLHQVEDGPPTLITLLADGKSIIGTPADPKGEGTWTLEGRTLILRWPAADAPGGAWRDACRVSSDWKTYQGTNQFDIPIYGQKQAAPPPVQMVP